MRSIFQYLAAGTLLALAATATAGPPTAESRGIAPDQDEPTEGPTPVAGMRWTAQVESRTGTTALLVTDEVTGTRYRLSDFEGIGVVHAHWIGPNQLEIDFPNHERVLEVRWSGEQNAPTFHLVTSRFDVEGAARVDYYSPPLVALLDRRSPPGNSENP